MLKLSLTLSCIAAAAALAGCARPAPQPATVIVTPPAASVSAAPAGTVVAAPTPITTTAPALHYGVGRIESVAAVPQFGSASEGATRPSGMRRIGVRMDDGAMQYLDSDAPALNTGDRIEITPDGYLRRPAS